MASDETGFFARVGPLQIFVSRHCMPEDISVSSYLYQYTKYEHVSVIVQNVYMVVSSTLKQAIAGCQKMRKLKYGKDLS